MAIRVWNRSNARVDCDFLSPLDSCASPLADDPWAERRSRTHRQRSGTKDYGLKCGRDHRSRLQRSAHAYSDAHTYAVARDLGRNRIRTSPAFVPRFCADVDPSVFLQLDLFHLRAGPDAILSRTRAKCGQLSLAVCIGKCARSAIAGASLRHNRTKKNDRRYLWTGGYFARADRLAFSRRRAQRLHANAGLDRDFLHRISGGELGLPDCERNFSAGNPRIGDRDFLRDWNACRRSWSTTLVRMDYRHRVNHSVVHRISLGSG